MIDDDDVLLAAIFTPEGGFALVIGLFLIILLAFFASENKEECAKQHCQDGAPAVLLDHECRCVSAVPKQ